MTSRCTPIPMTPSSAMAHCLKGRLLMYAHRIIQSLNGLHIQFDLPPEFADCQEAEIIVLPLKSALSNAKNWELWVRSMAGTLSDDFPDAITDDDLGSDVPRDDLE